jgi:hypothetical protein
MVAHVISKKRPEVAGVDLGINFVQRGCVLSAG